MEQYKKDSTWQDMQRYIPPENRLTESNLPQEYFLETEGFQVHIDHYKHTSPKARLILFHGVGGNGRLLSFIATPLHKAGYEVVCPDLPLYGNTQYSGKVEYRDWITVGKEIASHFCQDRVPLFLFGLSAGGMLAYQVACTCENINGIIATCILDQRNTAITKATATNPAMGAIAKLVTKLLHKPFGTIKLPMKMVAKMSDISNNPALTSLLMKDQKSSGAKVPLSFLHGMLHPEIEVEPEHFLQPPFLLVHPEHDRWTDVSLSRLFFDRLACDKQLHMLPGAGHFPLEPSGLQVLEHECLTFLEKYREPRV